MKDFPRPSAVVVRIFGEQHELHRLTRSDVWNLAEALGSGLQDSIGALTGKGVSVVEAVRMALKSGGPLLDELLKISFPTFAEWEALPLCHELELFDLVWDENDMEGIIEDFFALAGKMAKSSQKILTLNLTG